MARTYYWSDIATVAMAQVPRSPEVNVLSHILNMAQNRIWRMYDWRESLAPLPPFFIIPNEQDYYAPFYVTPSDFYGLRKAQLVQISGNPAYRKELKIVQEAQLMTEQSIPDAISYEKSLAVVGSQGGFRLTPRPIASMAATDWYIDGTYKKRPVKITAQTLNSLLVPWDDLYLNNIVNVVQWAYGVAMGSKTLADLIQLANAAIADMANAEGMNLGDPVIHPSEPLVGYDLGFFPYC